MIRYNEFKNISLEFNNEELLTECFFHRSDDKLKNLIHSFKSYIINLKQSIQKKYTINFFKKTIKEDLENYKQYILSEYKKSEIKEFKNLFKDFISEVDNELIKLMKLDKFVDDILKIYSDKNSFDINIKNIENIFNDYSKNLDKYFNNTNEYFYKKIEKNNYYEPLNNIDVKKNKLSLEEYQELKYEYQIELLKLQEWIIENNKKVLVIFEGRDASGKGSAIRNLVRHLNPKHYRVETFRIPTKQESDNWFDRYENVLPNSGEIVFFDRSWYTRGYVEPAMGYSSKDKYEKFMNEVNDFEKNLIEDDILLIKIWFSISYDVQKLRFEIRKSDPLKYWKFSDNDEKVLDKWDNFTKYINNIFRKTNTTTAPWNIIDADDESLSRIESFNKIIHCISKIKEKTKDEKINIIFEDIDGPLIPYDENSKVDYHMFFNNPNKWNKDAMKRLNTIIEKTDAKLVLTSSYSSTKTKKEIENMMKIVGYKYKIYDLVKNDDKGRGDDIKTWLKHNKNVDNYIIIDDKKHDLYDEFNKKHILKTTHELGITENIMDEAIKKLKRNK